MSETLLQSPILISSQYAVGRVTIASFPGYDMMVWNASDGAHTLHMGQRALGTVAFLPVDTGVAGFTSSLGTPEKPHGRSRAARRIGTRPPRQAAAATSAGSERIRWSKADSAAFEPSPMAMTICL